MSTTLEETFAMARSRHEDTSSAGGKRVRRRRRHRRTDARTLVPDPPFEEEGRSRGRRLDDGDAADVDLAGLDPATVRPETLAYLEARKLAEQKVSFYRRLVRAALITVPLLVFLPWLGVILLFVFGIDLGKRYFKVMVEPGLRDKLMEEEVRKQVHASLHDERRTLEGEHSRSLEQLSASIAHEIRNPITAAKSLVQQMGEEPAARENLEYARVALSELERVERSISHLLRFARDEDMRVQEVRMAEVVDSALETFRDRTARSGTRIDRDLDCEGSLRGDPEKLRRVMINLVGNAIDALEESRTPEPRLQVSVGENLAGSEVWVRIRDNGPGIDREVRERIWSPFYTSKPGGTGLGLAISRKLVEAHGGEIELESEPGGGTEFILTFPKDGRPNGDGLNGGLR